MNVRRDVGIGLVLVLVAVAVFWPVADAKFVQLDDYGYVVGNAHVRAGLARDSVAWAFTSTEQYNWHPLTWLSHMLDCQLFGPPPGEQDRAVVAASAGWHHLTNLFLHIVNTLLLFIVLKRMTGRAWPSAVVAALFAIHPLHVESVAWVSERKDVLSTLLAMLTLYAYARYAERPGFLRYVLVAVGLALGLMAKPMLVTLPFVMMLLDFWPLGRVMRAETVDVEQAADRNGGRRAGRGARAARPDTTGRPRYTFGRLLLEKAPLLVMAAISCRITWSAQHAGGAMEYGESVPLMGRVANSIVSYGMYLFKMIIPTDLAVRYPYVADIPIWKPVLAAAVLVAVTGAVLALRRRSPALAVGWFWFIGMLVPVIGLVQVSSQAMADRYTYVPLVGVFIMIAWGLADLAAGWPRRAWVLGPAAALAIIPLAMLAHRQVLTWADSPTLFNHALDVAPNNWLAHYCMASYLNDEGQVDEALDEYREAADIDPRALATRDPVGARMAAQFTQVADSVPVGEITTDPAVAVACYRLGLLQAARGMNDEAVESFREAIGIVPDFADAHFELGVLLADRGKSEQAIGHYREAATNSAGTPHAHFNVGMASLALGKSAAAIEHLGASLLMKPGQVRAHIGLGVALTIEGRIDEATAEFREAVRLRPGSAYEAHKELGAALLEHEGNVEESLVHFREALRLRPDSPEALNNLAWILATSPDDEFRRGPEAVELAEKACKLTGRRNPYMLGTLATAYAEVGQFDDAVRIGEQAFALAVKLNQIALATVLKDRLDLFHANKPYHDRVVVPGQGPAAAPASADGAAPTGSAAAPTSSAAPLRPTPSAAPTSSAAPARPTSSAASTSSAVPTSSAAPARPTSSATSTSSAVPTSSAAPARPTSSATSTPSAAPTNSAAPAPRTGS